MLWTGLRKSLNSQENQGIGIQVGKESVLSDYQTLTQGSVDLNVISQSDPVEKTRSTGTPSLSEFRDFIRITFIHL